MPSDKFAYRASAALTAALAAHNQACKDFYRDVLGPWEDAHAPMNSIWRDTMNGDSECIGFSDPGPDQDPPRGLLRNRNRGYLVPTNRGKVGDPWLTEMVKLNRRPKVSTVLTEHGVNPSMLDVDHSRMSIVGLIAVPGSYLLTWSLEHPECEHLTRIPLSEYYAAREALDAQHPAAL